MTNRQDMLLSVIAGQPTAESIVVPSGLVGYWPCNEGTGNTLIDAIPSGVGNMVFTGLTWGASWATLDGTSNANTTRTYTPSSGAAFSFCITSRYSNSSSNMYRNIIDDISANPMIWYTNQGTADAELEFDNGSFNGFRTGGTTYKNIWVHLALTKASGTTTANYYINGSSNTAAASYSVPATAMTFFRRGTGNYFWGDVRRIRLYNRQLSQSEVTEIYNADAI